MNKVTVSTPGPQGRNGWSPVFAVVADGERSVQQIVDWAGGTGSKPAIGKYVGGAGLVTLIADGVDIRGGAGDGGEGIGSGDVVGPASAVGDRIAVFDLTTGKLIKDGGRTIAQIDTAIAAVGTASQPANANLAAEAGLAGAADRVPYFTGVGAKALAVFTTFGRSLVAAADLTALKVILAYVKGDVGLGNVDNTADTAKPVSAAQQTALDLKATIVSPTFTGTPAAPTAAGGTNSTQLATTAFVKASLDSLVAGAPGALDTLNEIATQLATDESAVSALTTTVAGKVPATRTVAGHALSADITLAKGDVALGNVDNTADTAKPVSTAQQTALDLKAPLVSPAFTGAPTAPTPTAADSSTKLATTAYVDAKDLSIYNTLVASGSAALADIRKTILMNVATAHTFTIPPNSSVAFPVGCKLPGLTVGAGQTTITPGAGVTFLGGAYKSARQGSSWFAEQTSQDTWVVNGDLTA